MFYFLMLIGIKSDALSSLPRVLADINSVGSVWNTIQRGCSSVTHELQRPFVASNLASRLHGRQSGTGEQVLRTLFSKW